MSQNVAAPASASDILAGLLTRQQLADQLHCGLRTVIRRERQGMPFIAIGMVRLYDPATVRAWLLSHERRHDAPKRGRPSNKRAA